MILMKSPTPVWRLFCSFSAAGDYTSWFLRRHFDIIELFSIFLIGWSVLKPFLTGLSCVSRSLSEKANCIYVGVILYEFKAKQHSFLFLCDDHSTKRNSLKVVLSLHGTITARSGSARIFFLSPRVDLYAYNCISFILLSLS